MMPIFANMKIDEYKVISTPYVTSYVVNFGDSDDVLKFYSNLNAEEYLSRFNKRGLFGKLFKRGGIFLTRVYYNQGDSVQVINIVHSRDYDRVYLKVSALIDKGSNSIRKVRVVRIHKLDDANKFSVVVNVVDPVFSVFKRVLLNLLSVSVNYVVGFCWEAGDLIIIRGEHLNFMEGVQLQGVEQIFKKFTKIYDD